MHVVERAAALAAGRERVRAVYARHLKRAALDDAGREARYARVTVTDDWAVVGDADVVVDASPSRVDRVLKFDKPLVRVSYRFVQLDGPSLRDIVQSELTKR